MNAQHTELFKWLLVLAANNGYMPMAVDRGGCIGSERDRTTVADADGARATMDKYRTGYLRFTGPGDPWVEFDLSKPVDKCIVDHSIVTKFKDAVAPALGVTRG